MVIAEEVSILLSETAAVNPEVLSKVLNNACKDIEIISELSNAEVSIGEGIATSNKLFQEINFLKPLGRGSTGRIQPKNLHEKLAMIDAIAYSGSDIILNDSKRKILTKISINDPRWHYSEGWVKASYDANGIEIHYVLKHENGIVKAVDDFKFKF